MLVLYRNVDCLTDQIIHVLTEYACIACMISYCMTRGLAYD